jgi:SAM-dependent methyltransferase
LVPQRATDSPLPAAPASVVASQRWMLLPVLFVSAAAIGFELLLMRVLSIVQWHHFAWMIISLALLGYGASGTFIALARERLVRHFPLAFFAGAFAFAVSMPLCYTLGQRVPFNALEIVWDPAQFLYLGAIYLVFFVPFFFAASCIGLAFTCAREHISRIYFFDLFGAGLGALAVVLGLFVLEAQDALRLLSVLALIAAGLAGVEPPLRYRLMTASVFAVVLVLFALPRGWLEPRMSPYKGLSQALEVIDARVLAEESSPLGLLTVVESPTVPYRHAPGLSFGTLHEPPEQLAMFTDGDAPSMITRFDGDLQALGYMGDMPQAVPYRLLESPRVLVLGAGGGADVLFALYHGAVHVDAVELNPQAVRLVDEVFADFAGHLYDDPRVDVHIAEARGFVAATDESWDLIQVSLLDSFAASGSGVQALSESYLYTVEALEEYLRHLEPGGVLAITRWLKMPPRDSLKLVATAREALTRLGAAEPARHLAVIRSWNTSTLLIRRSALGDAAVAAVREFAREHSFDTAYYPSMPREEANRYNLLPEPWLYEGTLALLGDDAGAFYERYKFDVRPATDDEPYFFNFFRWASFEEMLGLREQGGAGLIEWGYPVVVGTFVQALVLGALLIVLPLAAFRARQPEVSGGRMGGYFFLLGLAFMFVEIAFIQKFILFLSHPLYAVAVVLAGFLFFAGIGSALSARVARHASITVVVMAIAGIAAAWLLLLPPLFDRCADLPDVLKIALSLAFIAPLAFFMGMPFPVGLARLAGRAASFIPWAWGLNGYASVISASLATLLAIEIGFNAVILLALLLYAAAAVVFRSWPRSSA